MSDADEDVSDIELDGELDDFDPLADLEEDADAPPGVANAESDEEEGVGEAKDVDEGVEDDGDDAVLADVGAEEAGAPEIPARLPAARRRAATPADCSVAQTVGTRRIYVVAPEDRQSSNMMTLAEITRAIALRAQQISTRPYAYTDVGDLSDAISIARKELFDRRSPLKLERVMGRTPLGESIIEMWTVREMSYPPLN